jgi:hypothetical protein
MRRRRPSSFAFSARNSSVVVAVRKPVEGDAYPSGHQFGNRLFNLIVTSLFGYGFRDIFSGYRALSRPFVKSFPSIATGFEIETEMSVHALQLNLPTAEIVTPYSKRSEGTQSKLRTYQDGAAILVAILRLLRHQRPFLMFGIIALISTLISVVIGLPVVSEFLRTGLVPRLPSAVLAASLMVIAVISFVTGIILDSVAHVAAGPGLPPRAAASDFLFGAAMTATLPRLALWFVAAAIVALYAHAIFYTPIAYGDQFQEIYYTLTWSPAEYLSKYLTWQQPLFRPGEVVMRYLILEIFGPHPFSYNCFQILYLVLTAIAAVSLLQCRNWSDAGAGITALTFLFGHHAFPAVMEANITFSNGLVLLLMLVALHILQSKGRLSSQILAIAISVAAVLTKEVGLVVPFTFVAGAVLGFTGVRRWTAALLIALVLAYAGFRWYTLPAFEGGTGAGTPHSIAERLSNMLATSVMIVTGEPFDGDWSQFLRRDFYPWRIIRIALGLATVALIFAAFSLRKAAAGAFPQAELVDRKWMLLLLGVVAASSALAFQYTRHRFGAMALPVAYLLLYRSLRIVVWRVSSADVQVWVRVALVPLLVVFSLAWSSRVADGFFVLRYTGAKTMMDWVEHYQKYREHEGRVHPQAGPYLDSFFWAAEEMPWPTIRHDPPVVRFWLGDEDVMNR